MGTTALRTPRLELRPLARDDLEELHELFNDPDVGRYLLDGRPVSLEWVGDEIASSHALFEEVGCGLWGVRERRSARDDEAEHEGAGDDAPIIGVAGFRHFFRPPDLQLLYALRPAAWGRGLATEAVSAVLEHVFTELRFEEVRAATDEPNAASVAVLQRVGMERSKVEEGEPWRTIFYELSAARWASREGDREGEPAGSPRHGGP